MLGLRKFSFRFVFIVEMRNFVFGRVSGRRIVRLLSSFKSLLEFREGVLGRGLRVFRGFG